MNPLIITCIGLAFCAGLGLALWMWLVGAEPPSRTDDEIDKIKDGWR